MCVNRGKRGKKRSEMCNHRGTGDRWTGRQGIFPVAKFYTAYF